MYLDVSGAIRGFWPRHLRSELPAQQHHWPKDGIHVPGFPGAFLPYHRVALELCSELQFLCRGRTILEYSGISQFDLIL